MDGVKIMRPSLDDIDKNTVLRALEAAPHRWSISPPQSRAA
jgi:hypothetical protein